MEDLISRQAAIECLEHLSACDEPFVEIGTGDETFIGKYEAITEISDLPSAQPEIIHCRDCKHYYYADNRVPQEQMCVCDLDGDRWRPDSFCSFGERREE